MIDSALLRPGEFPLFSFVTPISMTLPRTPLLPGRFDRILHVPLPTVDDRVVVLVIISCEVVKCLSVADMLLGLQRTLLTRLGWQDRVDIGWLAHTTEGYSPADLECVCRRVVIDCIAGHGGTLPADGFAVGDSNFRAALCSVKPALSREEATILTNWRPK
jgi:SpoVK/Ycf46/Vps4 family AAA+-type ATPase